MTLNSPVLEPPSGKSPGRSFFADVALLLLCLFLAGCSVWVVGFRFGTGNNVFHIPYVLRLYESQHFQGDAFYASLPHFKSGLWWLTMQVTTDQNIQAVFLVLHFLGRVLALCAIVALALGFGCRSRSALAVVLVVTAATPWLIGWSGVGRHGLFINHLTHSEFTWGLLLGSLLMWRARWFVLAALTAGLVMLINAFIGAWLVALFAGIWWCSPAHRPPMREAWQAAAVGLVFLAVVMHWLGADVLQQRVLLDFRYIEYIRSYYPNHFLIEASNLREMATLSGLLWLGITAASLTPEPRLWRGALWGGVAVFVLGSCLPYIVDSRWVFNLHLLRVDGVIHFLAVSLAIGVVVRGLWVERDVPRVVLYGVALSMLLLPVRLTAVATAALCLNVLAQHPTPLECNKTLRNTITALIGALVLYATVAPLRALPLQSLDAARYVVALLVALLGLALVVRASSLVKCQVALALLLTLLTNLVMGVHWQRRIQEDQVAAQQHRSFNELSDWVRMQPHTGPYLTPVDGDFDMFALQAHRPVWVEWKQGAAVMWQPAFYRQWATRFREVSALSSDVERLTYAQRQGLARVVVRAPDCPERAKRLYTNIDFSVCAVEITAPDEADSSVR